MIDHAQPLASAEFLVVDTETNGLAGDGVRADRDRRGARRRRRAARPLGDARRGARAAVARDPALHRDHPGDGRRGAAGRGDAARARRAAARTACSSPTTPRFDRRVLRQAFAPRRARLARPAGAVHGRARAPLRAARPPAQAARRWPSRSASRSRSPTARSPTPRPARACSARCSAGCARNAATVGDALALLRPARAGRARAGATARRARAARRAGVAPDVAGAARRARRLHRPQRRGPGALRRQVGGAAHARAGALRAVVAVDGVDAAGRDRRPPSRRAPSSARSCSSAG